jgi:putative inorganic carbon (HCO3(-)) transporter
MASKILKWSYYFLFFLTPLFFTDKNSELFEYNKMMLVYTLTVVIVTTWLFKMVSLRSFIFKRTPLDIPIFLFLLSQILSTIFSIDPHTSIWGYYSRSNGGLLSIISYILLFYGLVSNFDFDDALNFLRVTLFGGLAVSLWAIPEHFGHSPSCALLVGKFDDNCWVQDVQARVFATLGQPNWLAALMEMLIFPALYFAFIAKSKTSTVFYFLIAVAFYMAFTFTYSRGATLGLIVGMAIFLGYILVNQFYQTKKSQRDSNLLKFGGVVVLLFLLVNVLFGSAVSRFKLISANEATTAQNKPVTSGTTQLESGGTESGEIRLIVWQGALDIFKHYPLFGSGVETYAYSYYSFRPVAHNLTSEWDFLYNKAHNEYLNYLATTGALGFLSYLLMIGTFIIWSLGKMFNFQLSIFKSSPFFKLKKTKPTADHHPLLTASILAGYSSYLVQNFFGFSVVIIALLFYILPAYPLLATDSVKNWTFKKDNFFPNLLYRRPIYETASKIILIVIAAFFLYTLRNYWVADTLYKDGTDKSDAGSVGQAYNDLQDAVFLNPSEPLYHSELGYNAAAAAVAEMDTDATEAADLKDIAVKETQKSLDISPKNVSLWRTAIRTYFEISILDPSYEQKTLDTFDKTISLAPTDPKLDYNKALILETDKKYDEAIIAVKKAIELKPNYPEAIYKLGELYEETGDISDAKIQMQNLLKLIPNEPNATKKLEELSGTSVPVNGKK